tara:strand:- start:535 stop:714 length:180 start_codon:yes stop_codon:yes gene_type:complete
MPWKVIKKGDKFKLYNIDKKKFVNKEFKTRQAAINTRKNYERYSNIKYSSSQKSGRGRM